MKEAVNALAERVGIAALTREHGKLSNEDMERFRTNLKSKLEREEAIYPIYVALETALPDVLKVGEMAEIATAQKIRQREGMNSTGWTTPLTNHWGEVLQEVAEQATKEHLERAESLFGEERTVEAAEEMTHAVVCQVAAIAASRGWPHSEENQIYDAVTALATGRIPEGTEDTYKLMGTASDRGIDLANAFGASMGHPESLRMGMSNETNREAREDSQYYARTAMELARELSERGK